MAQSLEAPETTPRVILFDLDNTLFDHYHSMRTAVVAVQKRYITLQSKGVEDLIEHYNSALQQAYDAYLARDITYEEADIKKVRLFFTDLGLPEPSMGDIKEFRSIYKPAYQESRRATPGSIETLVRLRERTDYHLAILTNGQIEDQETKAKDIGVYQHVDCVITSEEACYAKPDVRIFQYALQKFDASAETAIMVGDSAESDIKGAIDAHLDRAILYSPVTKEYHQLILGQKIPIVHDMPSSHSSNASMSLADLSSRVLELIW
ncbi:HAD-like domain-containing protein [Stachybotrys elegans]|uniref:HAD-like domain-containing protein n=1 Tax=Stachybotrys elegans TaxID=80388 RepID=A0A8K0SG73_9HYPO|nr:HAD-like domain-containing protein [Stachybotrys elegans]